ncbi:MAG: membrane protein insertase YidC [Bacteroidales bacterium]|nr:membrane protein insertase YidC [Bacteroidales bacterium]
MDKNTFIGIALCIAIFIGFSIWNRPSEEQLAAQQRYRDSIAQVQQRKAEAEYQQSRLRDSIDKATATISDTDSDSAKTAQYAAQFGKFAAAATGTSKDIEISNNKMIVTFSTKGAMIKTVQLKDFKTNSGDSLFVIKRDVQNEINLDFFAGNNAISTKHLFFEYVGADSQTASNGMPCNAVFRAHVDADSWLEFAYSLADDSYLLGYTISFHNLDGVVNNNSSYIDLTWNQYLPVLERGNSWEYNNSGICYKYDGEDVEELGMTSDHADENLVGPTKWIACKGQFFSSVLISNSTFANGKLEIQKTGSRENLKFVSSHLALPSNAVADSMTFYFGPNKFKILKDIQLAEGDELALEDLVPLGWSIIGWCNRYLIIPLFNWLGSFISSYGLIILIMTLIVKLVLLPLTYKSYQSTAKMRVLRPQVEELNKKYPKQEDAMKKQQATMELYRKAGVSPMGGCLPMLLQMPVLIALFRFFPASIELRQQGFLWSDDLSAFDSVLDFGFSIPFYGDHVSLFALLMAGAMLLQTKISGQMDSGQQMPGMKLMMYMMPVMMLCWFNDYSSGLTYYYFLSNIIAILQIVLIRNNMDEAAILAKLNEKVAKNSSKKKKPGLLERLQEAQRKQMKMIEEQNKKKGKKR